ncbi:serine/threonine-protein kinase [Thermopolyspora sp. NPDC052614]|uniref:serine/threonine-protein kinase n=1 Tax=Thermopolyspora sp. NPDC052614 TaxID=3155682 RepID=UPI00341B3F72
MSIDSQDSTTLPLRPDDPETLGPYRLLGRLGQGGMGTVYLAAAENGRPVAVKIVREVHTRREGFAERFRAEVASARRVSSFCTSRVLDDGTAEDGRPYLVTEYIPGISLDKRIRESGALDPTSLHGVAFGVAAALAAIHAAGVVHQDLKPGNVILSMSGPRVIDFGVARALDDPADGELVGTPGWWAPEHVTGQRTTPAADVFAWGCLVAYAGNGRHPFGEGDAETLAARVRQAEPDLGSLPPPLDTLVRRALDRDPALRPTARELLLDLLGGGETRPAPAAGTTRTPADTDRDTIARAEPDDDRTLVSGRPQKERAAGRQGRHVWITQAALAATLAVSVALMVALRVDHVEPADAFDALDKPARISDVGRRIPLAGGYDGPQLLVQPPDCGYPNHEGGVRRPDRQTCRVLLTLVNMGPAEAPLSGELPVLVDDLGKRHKAHLSGGDLPATIAPGARLSLMVTYAMANTAFPRFLVGRLISGGESLRIRL